VTRTDERALENEKRFRDANEQIGARRRELSAIEGPTPFLCECEDERCTKLIDLTLDEYEAVRSDGELFFVASGHRARGKVVAEHEQYTVVRKAQAG
jgi:hypothetical protein